MPHSAQRNPEVIQAAAPTRKAVLIVAPNGSYRTAPYVAAARALGAEALVASQGAGALAAVDVPGIQIDFDDPDRALNVISDLARLRPIDAVVGTDDGSTRLAAQIARLLKLPHNPPDAVDIARRKDHARACLRAANVPVPDFMRVDLTQPLAAQAHRVRYPCVLKPLAMSASRGVIRADDPRQFVAACQRIAVMLRDACDPDERRYILAESFIPGFEIAVDGLLSRGRLEILAIFDKPDPLDGPYFEETYYITPSRLPGIDQARVHDVVQAACAAYGLSEGPIHAECRINARGVWMLEVAARTIGGLCGRLLRFGTGYGLEELVLRHALGMHIDRAAHDGGAGVLMIPIRQHGLFRRVEGLLDAERVEYIDEITIQIREGHELTPWPEGASYLGFMFARAPTAELAERALRRAHAHLNIVTAPLWLGTVVTSTPSRSCE